MLQFSDDAEGDDEIFCDDSMDEDDGADIDFTQVIRNISEDEPVMSDPVFLMSDENEDDRFVPCDDNPAEIQIGFIPDDETHIIKAVEPSVPRDWCELFQPFGNPNEENQFCEFTGVNRNASAIKSPIEAFQLFFSDNILDQTIVERNVYHDQVLEDDTNWKPIRREEILASLGDTIAMDIVKLPEIENY